MKFRRIIDDTEDEKMRIAAQGPRNYLCFRLFSETSPPETLFASSDAVGVTTFIPNAPSVLENPFSADKEDPTGKNLSGLAGFYTLNRKLTMSPSFMTYSLPSLRTLP